MSKFKLLNETGFVENKKGRLSKAQMTMLTGNKSWQDWLVAFLLLAGGVGILVSYSVDQVDRVWAFIVSVAVVFVGTGIFYSPLYSYWILSDVRKNNIALRLEKLTIEIIDMLCRRMK